MTTVTLTSFPWLSLLLVLPLFGALLCLVFQRQPEECKWFSLASSLLVLAITIWMFLQGADSHGWYFYEDHAWITRYGIRYTLGMDGISLLMVVLTGFLQVIAVAISWRQKNRTPYFFALLLLLETGVLGVFLALDLVLFYLFWELMLIPMLFLIGVWGHGEKINAAVKFLLFTMGGSLPMLLAIIALYLLHGQQSGDYTFALEALKQTDMGNWEPWLYAGFMLAFLVKVPQVPLHSWLPDAHAVAPTTGALDITGLLIKTGVFAILRFALPLFPHAAQASLPLLAILAIAALYHAAWVAYRQADIKRVVAYSSVSHLGVIMLGVASGSSIAMEGSILLMVCQGVTTGGLFALVAMIRRRTGTRDIGKLGGMWQEAPILGAFFLFFALASLGLPGLANFSGEILVFLGTFQQHPVWASLAVVGVVFAAAYILRLVQGVIWGSRASGRRWPDLTLGEILALVPLVIATLWLGFYPEPMLAHLHEPVKQLLEGGQALLAQGGLP